MRSFLWNTTPNRESTPAYYQYAVPFCAPLCALIYTYAGRPPHTKGGNQHVGCMSCSIFHHPPSFEFWLFLTYTHSVGVFFFYSASRSQLLLRSRLLCSRYLFCPLCLLFDIYLVYRHSFSSFPSGEQRAGIIVFRRPLMVTFRVACSILSQPHTLLCCVNKKTYSSAA